MTFHYAHAPGAVWRQVGDGCIVQLGGQEHLLEGGAAAIWVALAAPGDREPSDDRSQLVQAPNQQVLDETIDALHIAGLIVAA